MITSQQTSLLYELRQTPIPEATLVEFEARLQHRVHALILNAFNKSGLTQTELAVRLGWDTARVSRCLGASSNWTLKTISDLMVAIGVDLDDPSYTSFDELERRLNESTPAVATATAGFDNAFPPPSRNKEPESVLDMTGIEQRSQPPNSGFKMANVAKQRPRNFGVGKLLSTDDHDQRDAA